MIYRTSQGRVSSGEAIGILLLDTSVPFVPGDVANATTYDFPVRFKKVDGFTVAKAIDLDASIYKELKEAACELVGQGVRAITGDCGFMALHQRKLADELEVPVFLSSLLQIPFILSVLGGRRQIGILTANGPCLENHLLDELGLANPARLVVEGLEHYPEFYRFAIAECGELDTVAVENEMIGAARKITTNNPEIGALLLECSLLPPYSAALQEAVSLPVFDYITMINYVFHAVVKKRYWGFV